MPRMRGISGSLRLLRLLTVMIFQSKSHRWYLGILFNKQTSSATNLQLLIQNNETLFPQSLPLSKVSFTSACSHPSPQLAKSNFPVSYDPQHTERRLEGTRQLNLQLAAAAAGTTIPATDASIIQPESFLPSTGTQPIGNPLERWIHLAPHQDACVIYTRTATQNELKHRGILRWGWWVIDAGFCSG